MGTSPVLWGYEHVLAHHDETDFVGDLARSTEHARIVVYTDAKFLRDDPGVAAETVDEILANDPADGLWNKFARPDGW